MSSLTNLLLPIALLASPLAAHADERFERVIWDGHCRIDQRINGNGDLVERRRCRSDADPAARAARE